MTEDPQDYLERVLEDQGVPEWIVDHHGRSLRRRHVAEDVVEAVMDLHLDGHTELVAQVDKLREVIASGQKTLSCKRIAAILDGKED